MKLVSVMFLKAGSLGEGLMGVAEQDKIDESLSHDGGHVIGIPWREVGVSGIILLLTVGVDDVLNKPEGPKIE